MVEFLIEDAERKGAPPLISIWGPSTCGKTTTALLIARGIVGPDGQIGVIDTENGRAKYHADIAKGANGKPWKHLEMNPPFSPSRYIAASDALIKAGCDIVIIDSGSHVWEGEGGVLDMADKNKSNGLIKWKVPKTEYKKMVNNLLRATVPIIWCLRAKEGFEQVMVNGKQEVVNRGVVPISGAGLIYEMNISVLLGLDHKPAFYREDANYNSHPSIAPVKCPDELMGDIKPGEYLGEDFGRAIAAWVDSGSNFDKGEAEIVKIARDVAYMGTDRLKEYFSGLSKPEKIILKPFMDSELKALAADNDVQDDPESEDSDIFGGGEKAS